MKRPHSVTAQGHLTVPMRQSCSLLHELGDHSHCFMNTTTHGTVDTGPGSSEVKQLGFPQVVEADCSRKPISLRDFRRPTRFTGSSKFLELSEAPSEESPTRRHSCT